MIKLEKIWAATPILNKLLFAKSKNFQLIRGLAKLVQAVEVDSKLIDAERLSLLKTYEISFKDGVTSEDKNFVKFTKAFTKFLQNEIDLKFEPISENLLDGLDLSPQDYLNLSPFLKEDELLAPERSIEEFLKEEIITDLTE